MSSQLCDWHRECTMYRFDTGWSHMEREPEGIPHIRLPVVMSVRD